MKRELMTFIALMVSLIFMASPLMAEEWTGVVTETHCGAAHKGGTEKDIECIKQCVRDGEGKLALLVGEDVYPFANPETVTGYEGKEVIVSGALDSKKENITVESLVIAP